MPVDRQSSVAARIKTAKSKSNNSWRLSDRVVLGGAIDLWRGQKLGKDKNFRH